MNEHLHIDGDVILVEFNEEGRAHAAVLRESNGRYAHYGFDWSKRSGCYLAYPYTATPAGTLTLPAGAIFWALEGVVVEEDAGSLYEDRGPTRRLDSLPAAIARSEGQAASVFDPKAGLFADAMIVDAPPEHCRICDDWFADDDTCEHLIWSEGGFIGSGAFQSISEDESVRDSLLAFVDAMGLRELMAAALRSGDFRVRIDTPMLGAQHFALVLNGVRVKTAPDGTDLTDLLYEREAEFRGGFGWLATLDPIDTPDAVEQTIAWLAAEQMAGAL